MLTSGSPSGAGGICGLPKRYLIGGLYNKDYSTLGSILGSPYLGKLTYRLL